MSRESAPSHISRFFKGLACTTIASLSYAVSADGSLGVAAGFNAFIEQDFSAQYTDIQGRLAAGGNVQLDGYGLASTIVLQPSDYSLVVGGDITFATGMIYAGSVIAGGSAQGLADGVRQAMQAESSVVDNAALPLSFAEEFVHLRKVSLDLSNAESNGVVSDQYGSLNLTGDCTSAQQVFAIDGSVLRSAHTFSLECAPDDATLVFNVSGTAPGLENIGLVPIQTRANNIIWNFYQAETIHFANVGIEGTVLAPLANLETPWGYINGTVIAKSWSGHMELHHVPFTGDITPLILADNTAPEAQSQTLVLDEDTSVSVTLFGSDAENDPLTYEIVTSPSNGTVSKTDNTVVYTPSADFFGTDQFTYRVFDGKAYSTEETIALVVNPINDAPDITSTPISTASELDEYSYPVVATDPDADALAYGLAIGPVGMSIDQATSVVTWTPTLDYVQSVTELNTQCYITEWSPSTADAEANEPLVIQLADLRLGTVSLDKLNEDTYLLGAEVTNRGLVATHESVDVAFYAIEAQSTVYLGSASVGALASEQSTRVSVEVQASALTGDIEIIANPVSGVEECNVANNLIKVPVVKVSATDPGELSDEQLFIINVEDRNSEPTVLNDEALSHAEGSNLNIVIETSDEDIGDAHRFTLVSGPSEVSLDPRTGRLTANAGELAAGDYELVVEIKDLRGATVLRTISLSVAANLPPEITSEAVQVVNQSTPYRYIVDAVDPNEDILIYSTNIGPGGADIETELGLYQWGGSSQASQGLHGTNFNCQADPIEVVGRFTPVVKWKWKGNKYGAYGPVSVGQMTDDNGDGVINELDDTDLVLSHTNGKENNTVISLIDGATGEFHWQEFELENTGLAGTAIADMDSDGIPEIYVLSADATKVLKVSNEGFLLASFNSGLPKKAYYPNNTTEGTISIADIDADGDPEIIAGRNVINSDGTMKWAGDKDYGGLQLFGSISVVADIDLDGKQEVIAGRTIYNYDGTVLSFNTLGRKLYRDGFNAVANFDSDPEAEIVFVGPQRNQFDGAVVLFDTDGSLIWGPKEITGTGGPPIIGDMDGDGLPEIGVGGSHYYYVFEHDGTLKWKSPTRDYQSTRTGSAVFDFEGDGKVEIVYSDEYHLRIYDGSTGELRYERASRNYTVQELPVVADIDNDGAAELVYGSAASAGTLTVLESADNSWAPTRRIWNQHAYSITNINDDLTVPANPEPNWLTHNSFRQNDFPNRPALGLADLAIHSIRYLDDDATISATLVNRGLAPVLQPSAVRFYHLEGAEETLLGEVDVASLKEGQSIDVSFDATNVSITGTLRVEVVPAESVRECVFNNNSASAQIVEVQATDQLGLFDRQKFAINVAEVNEAPHLTSSPVSEGIAGEEYTLQLSAEDPDLGDTLKYSLVGSPLTMEVRPFDGVIQLEAPIEGTYEFTIRVEDSGGLIDEQTHVLTISPPDNLPPEIHSEAPRYLDAGELYHYQIDATDPEGEPLYFALSRPLPGMSIDENTGEVYWQTSLADVGVNTAEIIAIDPQGKYKKEYFIVEVSDPNSTTTNNPPVISATVLDAVYAGIPFTFTVVASDPDGDALEYSLVGADGDMAINADGRFTWLPTMAMAAQTFEVTVVVSDGRGGEASQTLTLPVNEGANAAPELQSLPLDTAYPEATYRYEIMATDPDGDAIVYSLVKRPNGMTLENKLITWVPAATQAGQAYPVELWLEDARGAKLVLNWTINVPTPEPPNTAPEILNLPTSPAFVDQMYRYDVLAADAENDPLTYSVNGPDAMSINAFGELRWLPTADDVGLHTISIVVDDGRASYTSTFTLEVVDVSDNSYPVFTISPNDTAIAGVAYPYQLLATDADGDELVYGLFDGPEGAAVSPIGELTWTPSLDQVGIQDFVVYADDGKGRTLQSFSVRVLAEPLPLSVDVVVTPELADPGDTVVISVLTSGGSGEITRSLAVDGADTALTTFGQAEILAEGIGRHSIDVVVVDANGSQAYTGYFTVRDISDNTPPIVSIEAPALDSSHLKTADIIASVQDDNLLYYKVMLSPRGREKWQVLAEGEANVTSATVATLEPSTLINGFYDIAVLAEDINGELKSDTTTVLVEGDLKVGNFSITLEDLTIPMVGIPIQVTRTYDSRRRFEALDFGYGWSIDYQNVRVEESRALGAGWDINDYGRGPMGLVLDLCVEPLGAPLVTVTLPDGNIEKFEVAASPRCNTYSAIRDVKLTFKAVGDTQSTLEALNDNLAYYMNGQLVESGQYARPVDPSRYRLTTRTGYQYYLNQETGIEKVIDPNGHTLTYTNEGIFHSSGKSLTFERNSAGKIRKIIDPSGEEIVYDYEDNGDLKSVTDAALAETTYTYNSNHGLLEIFDPLNRKLVKNLYDDDGRLYAQEDGDGIIKTFDHQLTENSSVVTDRDGRTTVYNYDDEGNVLNETLLIIDGSYDTDIVTSYTYDDNGNQETKTVGSEDYTWTSGFDARNNLLFTEDPEGNRVDYVEYNARGQETVIEDELDRITTMHYDTVGNLLAIEMPEWINPTTGEAEILTASNDVDLYGQVNSTTDLRGLTTTYTYYEKGHAWEGQKKTETNPVTGTITYTYDANNNVKTETRERTVDGIVTEETVTYEYDKRNLLTKTIYPDNSYTQTDYDLAGNVDRARDRFGVWTDYEYDAYGRLRETLYADGTTESRTYTPEGLLETVTDRSNHTTRYDYDDAGRQWKVTYHDDTYTETRYTPQGWVQYEWDEKRNLTEYEYDLAGRRKAVIRHYTDAQGMAQTQRHSFTYYANGELHTETDANDHTTTYVINALDQRTETQFHNGTATQSRYDAMGTQIKSIDQNAIVTDFRYDDLGRLEEVQPDVYIDDKRVPNTSYTYDEVGNKLSQTDANGHTSTWTYDYFGRVLTRTLPETMSESFVYDDLARTQTHTDFNGQVSVTQYDNMGQVETVSYDNGQSESYTYWPNGQINTVTDKNGITQYGYTDRDRLDYEIQADGTRLDYDYDDAGNRTLVEITRNDTVVSSTSYTYDELNRLETVTDANGTTVYTYDAVGNLDTVTYPNNLVEDYDYNAVNQLTTLTIRDADGLVINSYTYVLDDTGRRDSITEADGRFTDYDYDDLYRLTGETITDSANGNYAATYQYDWVGNRTYETVDGVQTDYEYDDNDRLEQQGGTVYDYDNNGNLRTETLDGVTTTYYYDERNKLISVDTATGSVDYSYNHSGIRTSKTEAGETTEYIVDSNRDYAQVLFETDGTNTVVYTYGHDLISQERGAAVSYFLYDGLGSTRALADSMGVVTDTYDYEAFGEVLNQTGSTENNYLFTGEQYDYETGNYYLRARYMSPEIGRFDSMDTWMGSNYDPITLHKYLYANADPMSYIDPTGNFSIGSMMSTVNTIGTLASRAQTIYTVFQIATGEKELSARQLATEILLSRLPIKWVKKIGCKKNSFVYDTLVMTDEGLIPIQQIEIGDLVLSYNETNDIYEFKEVIHLISGEREYELNLFELDNNYLMESTSNHKFFVEHQWLEANEINPGDTLFGFLDDVVILNLTPSIRREKVYNLTVKGNHNYFVTPYLVLTHNDLCDYITSKVDPRKVVNAIKSYKGKTWQIGGHKFRLTRERMKHILERHHPKFFDVRKAREVNTPLPESWSLQDIEAAILVVINQNRSKLIKAGSGARRGQFEGVYKGVRFRLGIKNGQIGQLTPLE